MKRIMILLIALIGAGCLFAEPLEVTPVIKSELLFIQTIEENATAGSLILGEQDLGITATKGKTTVQSVANFSGSVDNITVGLSRATITQGINDVVSVKAGYDTIPFGYWTSNSVNYPLARFGGYTGVYSPVKTASLQVGLNVEKGIIKTELAGYQGTSGSLKSIAARVSADLTIIAPELSIKSDDFDSTSVAIGIGIDLEKVLINTSFFTGLGDVDNAGIYFEFSILPTDAIIVAFRGESLNNKEFTDGEVQFSVSGLYLLNDNVYLGMEYNSLTAYGSDDPVHTVTGLIGYEF